MRSMWYKVVDRWLNQYEFNAKPKIWSAVIRVVVTTYITFFAMLLSLAFSISSAATEISFSSCSISRSDLELNRSSTKPIQICSDDDSSIKIELQRPNRAELGRTGDLTQIFNQFGLDSPLGELAASYVFERFYPRVWVVIFRDTNQEVINTISTTFVWSRDFDRLTAKKNKYATLFGPTRAIRCHNIKAKQGEFEGCITYYNAPVCDVWNQGTPGPIKPTHFPVIAVRTETNEDSLKMLRNYEIIQQMAEELLSEILEISCEGE